MFLHHLYHRLQAMKPERFHRITARYPRLRIAVVGDYFLDRYLQIDPREN